MPKKIELNVPEDLKNTTVMLDLVWEHTADNNGVPNYYRGHARNLIKIECNSLLLFSADEKNSLLRSKVFLSRFFCQYSIYEKTMNYFKAFFSFFMPGGKHLDKLEVNYDHHAKYSYLINCNRAYVGYLLSERREVVNVLGLGRFYPLKDKLDQKVDIYHIPCFGQASYKKNAINVVTIHDQIPLRIPHTHNAEFIRFSFKRMKSIMKYYQYYFFVSRSAMEDTIKIYSLPRDRCLVTYLPIRVISERVNEKNKFMRLDDSLSDKPYWLFVSRPAKSKNILGVLESFLMSGSSYNLVFAISYAKVKNRSSDPLKKLLSIAQRSNGKITIIEKCSDAYLNSLYRSAFGLLHPSFYEGFGMTIAEAMYFGCPVITSNVSSMPEVAGGSALLVNPYNTEEIAAAINRVENDDELRNEMIKLGKKRVEFFSDENYKKRISAAYQYCLDHTNGKLEDGVTFDTYYQPELNNELIHHD